ncbi:MAG TPA: tetratricopeptide repeat protein [Terriglobales bacterium]|nr:tetratricopeptide repeat protein [Terriglobales bacterium]
MNFSTRWPYLLPLALALALFAPVSTVASESQWLEVDSPHFSVVTDAGEKRGREVAQRFEQMRSVFSTLLTKAHVNLPIPLQIVAFRNSKELRQVVPLWHGKPIQVAGLFQGGQDRCFIMLDMSVENPWTVVFHEYAHQLMNGNLTAQVDPWFQEGFAEYFSTIEVDGKQARVGKIPDYDYQILQQMGMMRVADLFRVQQNSATYNESGDHRTTFYAESSMVVHYLYDNGLLPKLATYFTLKIDKGVPVDQAIQQSFGMSAAQFDKELRSYLTSGRFKYYAIPSPAEIVKANYTAKPLTQYDSGAVIADIHLHSMDYHEKAAAEFQEILKGDPNNAAAARGLGYAYLQARNFDGAAEYFKRAAQEDSKDPRVHYYSAMLMSREGSFTDGSNLPDVVKELQTAISLDPTFADAYMLLAFAQARSGDPKSGLTTMQKAVALNPQNEQYRFNLAQMYLNNQQADEAVAILEVLSRSSDQMVAMKAAQSLEQAREFKESMEAHSHLENSSTESLSEVSPQLRKASAPDDASAVSPQQKDAAIELPQQNNVRFIKGTVTSVDCSAQPAALVSVLSAGKTFNISVPDSKHVLLIGADAFSCAWKKQKVAINYRVTGDTAGEAISIEVQ